MNLIARLALLAFCTLSAFAAVVAGSGPGGAIPDCAVANCDLNPGNGPGIFVSAITINDPRHIAAAGNNVTVTLSNFNHPYIGDLRIGLQAPGFSPTIWFLNRPGALQAAGLGYGTDLAGTYRFNTSFAGEQWTVAPVLPPGDYQTQGEPYTAITTNFSSQYNGQPVNGEWTLVIMDLFSGDTGTLGGWSLEFNVAEESSAVPEPGQLYPMLSALLIGLGAVRARRKR
jgi:subtilisin-like proprotein convertase family protein